MTNAVIGGILGAVVGNAVGHSSTDTIYRFTIQTDGGAIRTYDVGNVGDLRTGDRVRVANGIISRY